MLTKETKVLTKVTLRSQQEKPLAGDVWQVNSEKLVVEQCQSRQRCTTCQRITTRPAPKATCTRHNCHGTTVAEQPDQENYDVWLMGRPFVMVSAEEHTAQVPGEVRNRIENDFKSPNGRTNCLVATPTLELGVNIGALDMALMRNVPPEVRQLLAAGRAGSACRCAALRRHVVGVLQSPHARLLLRLRSRDHRPPLCADRRPRRTLCRRRPLRYKRVRYEDIVDDQESEVRDMLSFVGAPFDRRCLDFHENRRYARTASYAQVTEKLYDRSRFRYRAYLSELAPVLPILEPVIRRLGYEIE